jgi:hypothetical protein
MFKIILTIVLLAAFGMFGTQYQHTASVSIKMPSEQCAILELPRQNCILRGIQIGYSSTPYTIKADTETYIFPARDTNLLEYRAITFTGEWQMWLLFGIMSAMLWLLWNYKPETTSSST